MFLTLKVRFVSIGLQCAKCATVFVSQLWSDMTRSQLLEAVENYQDTTRAEDYYSPELKRILPYLTADDDMPYDASTLTTTDQEQENEELYFKRIIRTRNRKKCRSVSNMSSMLKASGGRIGLSA